MNVMIAKNWEETAGITDEACAAATTLSPALILIQIELEKFCREKLQIFQFTFKWHLNHLNMTSESKLQLFY